MNPREERPRFKQGDRVLVGRRKATVIREVPIGFVAIRFDSAHVQWIDYTLQPGSSPGGQRLFRQTVGPKPTYAGDLSDSCRKVSGSVGRFRSSADPIISRDKRTYQASVAGEPFANFRTNLDAFGHFGTNRPQYTAASGD
jgi:hypothetical protein